MRVITTYNAGPFAAGAALASFDRIGACHIPMATGNTERVLMAIERLKPDAVVATPSYAKYLAETGDVKHSSVTKVLVAGEPGGGEPGFRGGAGGRRGARASPRRWGSATSASRCGASASTRTGCTWARTASSTRS